MGNEHSQTANLAAIDIHAHFLPQLLMDKIQADPASFPYLTLEETAEQRYRFRIGSEAWTRPVSPDLINLEQRIPEMDRQQIKLQLNAGWLDIFGYSLPAEEGAAWSRVINQTQLEALRQAKNGSRFASLATVPLQDGEKAAAELRTAVAEGHVGVMIGTWIPAGEAHEEKDLDHPSLDPFWQAAAELGTPVFLHPVFAGATPRAAKWGLVNTVARPNETALSLARMLYAGIPHRFPGLKLVVSHGGGSLPFILGRLKRNYDVLKEQENIYDPVEGFQQLYFDTVVFSPESLRYLMQLIPVERIMAGSDAPFPIRDPYPRRVVESAELSLSVEDQKNILYQNAVRIFRLEEEWN